MNIIKYFLVVIFSSQFLLSCKNISDRAASSEDENAIQECYLHVSESDSIKMDISINGNRISGNLKYNFYEKDDNAGTLKGELRGDKLTAFYSYTSEGTKSSRQVIFQKNGDTFIEGYYVDGNYTIADFPGTVVLRKVPCE